MLKTAITKRLSFVGLGRIPTGSIIPPTLGLFIILLVINGCTMVGPDYVKPEAPEPEQWLYVNEPELKSEETNFSDWCTIFKDPALHSDFNIPKLNRAWDQDPSTRSVETRPTSLPPIDIIQLSILVWMPPGSWMSGANFAARCRPASPTSRRRLWITTIFWCR